MRNFIYLNKWRKRVLPESAEEFHSPRKGEERRCADIASHILYKRVVFAKNNKKEILARE
jgi:hypothetical protein